MADYKTRGAQLLDQRLRNLGLSRQDAAVRVGVTRQALHQWIATNRVPDVGPVVKMEEWLAIPARAWTEPPDPEEQIDAT
jgi:transcriptional regulator with XRE-family HTH domain